MGTFYSGNRTFYTEGERLFNNANKTVEYNPVTLEPITSAVEETHIEEKFLCDKCDYEAKSNAGLSAHKRSHPEEKTGASVFKVSDEG